MVQERPPAVSNVWKSFLNDWIANAMTHKKIQQGLKKQKSFWASILGNNTSNFSTSSSTPTSTSILAVDPRTSEDCLFLDVIVPENVFNATSKSFPVPVCIYSGGYTTRNNTSSENPAGLFAAGQENRGGGIVLVAMSYRLGLFVRLDSFSSCKEILLEMTE